MIWSNIHTHSSYSDGANTLEEMVQAALADGFVSLGFSEHAYAPYDTDCCIPEAEMPNYLAEMATLKAKYAGQIELYTGLEVDCYHPTSKKGLDFTIGSMHYIHDPVEDVYYSIDYLHEHFALARDHAAGGDIRRMAKLYYTTLLDFVEDDKPDVIGHLDLLVKLNGDGRYFDESSGWYRALLAETAERVAATGCIVEVNTGGIARGYRAEPYPSRELLSLLFQRKVPVMLNSDSHAVETLDFWFGEAAELLREVGYKAVCQLRGGRFVEVGLI